MPGHRPFAAAMLLFASAFAATAAPTLSTAVHEEYGVYITGPDGRPVYTFVTSERGGDDLAPLKSCDTPCRLRWPLVFSEDDVTVDDHLSSDLAGTAEDSEGKVVTYANQPLFYFYDDVPGGAPQGQGIHSFGGWWYLLTPDGAHIDTGITPEIAD